MKPSHVVLHVTDIMTTKYCEDLAVYLNRQDENIAVDIVESKQQIQDISDRYSCIVMSADREICSMAYSMNIPFIPVVDSENSGTFFENALYVMEMAPCIDINNIYRIYQRYKNIPWTICETKRMIIREQTVDDVCDLYEIYDDPEVIRFTESLYEDRDEEIKYMKDYIDKQYRFFEYGIWALVDKKTQKLIGRAGISDREGYSISEIGYVIRKEYRNKGYAGEALNAILSYAAEELNMNEMQAFTLPENAAGIHLLKRLKFTKVGEDIIMNKLHDRYYLKPEDFNNLTKDSDQR